jgi:hypothetical protein
MKLALLALAALSLAVLLWPRGPADVALDPASPSQKVAAVGAPVAPAPGLPPGRPEAPDPALLQSPDPTEIEPPALSAATVKRMLRKRERGAPPTDAPSADTRPPEEAATKFAAGFRAAMAEHEGTSP